MHQRVSRRLEHQLEDYFHERSIGEVFYAPLDVILTDHDIFIPDLLVVSNPSTISKRGIDGPPLLIVEILSPSTSQRDGGVKARRYAELGVEHYWITDPETHRLECHRLIDGAFRMIRAAEGDAVLSHPDFPGLEIDLAKLWQ
jgi:Uma2 family endonuclease